MYLLCFVILLPTVPTPTIIISPSVPMQGAMVGSPQVINCTVNTISGVESSSVMISWMGPGGGTIISDSRVTISPTTSSGNYYTSSLQFTYLMEGDEGTYTCNVMILETSESQMLLISLISKSKLGILDYLKLINKYGICINQNTQCRKGALNNTAWSSLSNI